MITNYTIPKGTLLAIFVCLAGLMIIAVIASALSGNYLLAAATFISGLGLGSFFYGSVRDLAEEDKPREPLLGEGKVMGGHGRNPDAADYRLTFDRITEGYASATASFMGQYPTLFTFMALLGRTKNLDEKALALLAFDLRLFYTHQRLQEVNDELRAYNVTEHYEFALGEREIGTLALRLFADKLREMINDKVI